MRKRVVITASGIISSLGTSDEEIIRSLTSGPPVFSRPEFDSDAVFCPIETFNLKEYTGRFKDARYLNRGAGFAVAAAMLAIQNSGLDTETLEMAGVFSGVGPNMDISGESMKVEKNDIVDEGLSALWLLKFLPNTVVSSISKLAGIHGENNTSGSACAASLTAIGEAYRKIKDGYLDTAIAGGGDSRLNPGGLLAYKKAQAVWVGAEKIPEKDYVPFGLDRSGFIPGEGGAFVVLESLEQATRRGATILAEVCGFSSRIDGYNMTAPNPEGKWAKLAVVSALDEAGVEPKDIRLISSHGTGTQLNDSMESEVIQTLFSENPPPVIALKSWIGHLASACGAAELAICLACMEHGRWPEIRHLNATCNESVNFVKKPLTASPEAILLENFGFGGQNSALVIKQWND